MKQSEKNQYLRVQNNKKSTRKPNLVYIWWRKQRHQLRFQVVEGFYSVVENKKMPCLNISTNVNLEGVDTSSVLSEATSIVAKIIGKPEAYVMIVLKGSVPMSFGGTEQPAAYAELVSIGGLNADVNKKLSAAIAETLETKLSVPKSRFFLKFYDAKGSFFGWNGDTF